MPRLSKEELVELEAIAFSDIGDAFGPDNMPLPLDKMPEGIRRAIKFYKVTPVYQRKGGEKLVVGQTIHISLHNKTAALKRLMREHMADLARVRKAQAKLAKTGRRSH